MCLAEDKENFNLDVLNLFFREPRLDPIHVCLQTESSWTLSGRLCLSYTPSRSNRAID